MRKLLVIFGLLFVLGMAQAQTPRMAVNEAVSNVQGVVIDEGYLEDDGVVILVVRPSQYLSEDLTMLMVDMAFILDGRMVTPWTLQDDGSLMAGYLIYGEAVVVMYDGRILMFAYRGVPQRII